MSQNFNSGELELPQWLDKTFLEQALRSYMKDCDVKIKNFESQPATKVGDHFASIMFRISIDYDSSKHLNEKIQVIVKTLPSDDEAQKDYNKCSSSFKTEIKMYSEVLPNMERLLKNTGDHTRLCPTLIYHTNAPVPTLILEDLSVSGYEMSETTLDFDDANLVATRIAKFHAVSMVLQANVTSVFLSI